MFLLLLTCAGDIEFNPGLKKNNISNNFFAIGILTVFWYITFQNVFTGSVQHKFDMICLSETFLDSSITTNDENLNMKGYKLVRTENSSDSKKCGVGMYYKEFLVVRPFEVKNPNECVLFEVFI